MHYRDSSIIAHQYDIYYLGGDNSLYNKRFGKRHKVTLREKELLVSNLKSAIDLSSDGVIKIMDFGCGNGRTMPVLCNSAFLYTERQFEVTAYDISRVGLHALTNIMLKEGFELIGDIYSNSWHLKKYNVNVKVLLGNPDFPISELEKLFDGGFNLVLSLFGVLSHIPESARRIEVMQMFRDIACNNGILFISLPSYASHKATMQQFDKLRDTSDVSDISHLAKEKGDIYYKVADSDDLYNFYHLYSPEEAVEQLKTVKIMNSTIGIYSTFLPSQICQNWFYMIGDYAVSKIFSFAPLRNVALRYFAKYFFISAKIEKF